MIKKLACTAALAALVFLPGRAHAQGCTRTGQLQQYNMAGPAAVLARALDATRYATNPSAGIFRSAVRTTGVCLDSIPFLARWMQPASSARVEIAPVSLDGVANSAYPRAANDGVLWAGKGLNSVITAGALGRWRFLSAALMPAFVYEQNADLDSPEASWVGRSPFANPDFRDIDLPLRMGDRSISLVHPGQSFLRADVGPVNFALSSENLWLGSAQEFPLLLSSSAPGFPHIRVGTTRPINLKIVNLETNLFWGSVSESKYFDLDAGNDNRLFTGTGITIEPRFLRGLYLGIARVYMDTADATGHSAGYYLSRVIESPLFIGGGNRPGNAIGALHFRWVSREGGFEAYGEWSREDTPYNLVDILREPDWTQAYGAGVQKILLGRDRLTRVFGEFVHLGAGAASVRTGRGPYTTYTHARVEQGHTNEGQMLGSWTGPGSDAQRVGADSYDANAMTGIYLERVRYADDAYYTEFARYFGEARHDVEVTLGLRRVQQVRGIEVNGGLTVSRRWDRGFIPLREADSSVLVETNIGTQLMLRWTPNF